jgi:ribosomal protein S18 acetylase RimI-like enzyme
VFRLSAKVKIIELTDPKEKWEELSALLVKVVNDGASIGFMPLLEVSKAKKYWETVVAPDLIVFIATISNEIVGSVQLHLCTKENGYHRAEIGKLMTNPDFRRCGIGRSLMQKAEERAKQERRSLIVLDTREGDVSNQLYTSLGYTEVGRIPNYARSANGELHGTVIYYKSL